MGSDPGGTGHAYPYHSGWRTVGCGVVLFGVLGLVGLALAPVGYDKFERGNMPLGVMMMLAGVFAVPTLLMALRFFVLGVWSAVRPPLVRVAGGALHLTRDLRGEPEPDADGDPRPGAPPPHPETLPLAAVRSVRREGPPNPGSDVLVIEHDLAAVPLRVEQAMMHVADFDALEAVLRAAIPAAFAPAPPAA